MGKIVDLTEYKNSLSSTKNTTDYGGYLTTLNSVELNREAKNWEEHLRGQGPSVDIVTKVRATISELLRRIECDDLIPKIPSPEGESAPSSKDISTRSLRA